MSGLTPVMKPPLPCSAATASSACASSAGARGHGNGAVFGHRLPQAGPSIKSVTR